MLIAISHVYCILLVQLELKEWLHDVDKMLRLRNLPWICLHDSLTGDILLWLDFILVHLARNLEKSYPQNDGIWILRLVLCRTFVLKYNTAIISTLNYPIALISAWLTLSVSRLPRFLEAGCSPLLVETNRAAACLRLRHKAQSLRLLMEAVMYFDSCSAK